MSNDKYNSAEHRVILNTQDEARVSIAVFFTSGQRRDSVLYGPLPELVSSEDPPKYRNFTLSFWGHSLGETLVARLLSITSDCNTIQRN
jgi:isopenicillin N synthase-like dioxygenase